MKVALIRRNFSRTGSAELYLERLFTALCQRQHEVHLFAEHWGDVALDDVVLHSITVHGSRATRPMHFAYAVKQLIKTKDYDCVFSLERTVA